MNTLINGSGPTEPLPLFLFLAGAALDHLSLRASPRYRSPPDELANVQPSTFNAQHRTTKTRCSVFNVER
jgi:hypothetical protein